MLNKLFLFLCLNYCLSGSKTDSDQFPVKKKTWQSYVSLMTVYMLWTQRKWTISSITTVLIEILWPTTFILFFSTAFKSFIGSGITLLFNSGSARFYVALGHPLRLRRAFRFSFCQTPPYIKPIWRYFNISLVSSFTPPSKWYVLFEQKF